MTIPYCVLMIKPLSVGRGDAPRILSQILEDLPIALRMFRAWTICDTTADALAKTTNGHTSTFSYELESIHPPRHINSWICLFTHIDRVTDPTELLTQFCGPIERSEWRPEEVRYQYSGFTNKPGPTAHGSDTVVHLSTSERANYEANVLFLSFDEASI